MTGAAVEKFLNETVEVARSGPAHTRSPTVKAQTAVDEMNRHGATKAVDRVGAPGDFGSGGGGKRTEAEFT